MAVLSLEKLIKEKVALKQSDEKQIDVELNIPRLDGTIKLSFAKSDIRDFSEVASKAKEIDEYKAAGLNLIYTAIKEPNLKDKDLQKAYECVEPTDIVEAIFTDGEMSDILDVIHAKGGLSRGSVVEVQELKN